MDVVNTDPIVCCNIEKFIYSFSVWYMAQKKPMKLRDCFQIQRMFLIGRIDHSVRKIEESFEIYYWLL